MKSIGGIIAWLGGMEMLLGLLLFLLSLKNPSDLHIWNFLGLVMGGGGLFTVLAGWAISTSRSSETDLEN